MREGRSFTVIVWAAWSAVVAAGVIYLGANTEAYRARWPQAGLTGAAVGGAGGALCLLTRCNRPWAALLGIPFGLLLGIGASLLFSGK
jgi:hypothetical protein